MTRESRSTSGPTRRDFLKVSATAASAAALGGLAIARGAHAAGSDVIKIGMIGAGGRCAGAAENAMNAGPDVRLVAVTDLFRDRAEGKRKALQQHKPNQVAVDDAHVFSGFDGYKHVIESVDVVLIACAAKFHPFYMHEAVKAGKHVFVEKPHAVDPAGVKEVLAACKLAEQKKLSVVSGLQSRFEPGYQEAVKRIHDGAIGDVVAIEENFLRGPYGLYKRAPGLNEVQYQCSNQYHFTWLSGDDVPQSLVHNVDRSFWVLKEQPPLKCHGLGGRSSSFDEIYGDVFDHHSVIYHYQNGVRLYAFCRTEVGCYNECDSIVMGSKGICHLTSCRIEGENPWQFKGKHENPYDLEHKALFESIRSGKPINSGYHMAHSTLATVMGQISCYTGKEVTWKQALESDFHYPPKPAECTFDMDPPVKLGPDKIYPVRVPGVTKLI